MTKKIVCLVMAVLMLVGTTVFACNTAEELPIGYYNIVYADRYLFFATDGGSSIDFLKLPRGTKVNLNEYIPTKDGYDFEGWYASPREKIERLTEVTLDENTVVWAKWKLKEGVSEHIVYENLDGIWGDSDIRMLDWYVEVIDVNKLTEDANLPKIDNFVVNAVYNSSATLNEKSITIYEGDEIQSLSSVSPASNKFIVDFGQRMLPEDMTKDNIYITSKDDTTNPIVTNDKYSDGKYEMSPVDYLVPGKEYIIHINACRNVSGNMMTNGYTFEFTAGSGSVTTELSKITQNGAEVSSLAGLSEGNAKIGVMYKNSTGKKYLLHYIIAFYNGNEMVHSIYASKELDAYAVGQISEISVSIPNVTEEYNEMNIIAWDSFNGMLPVSKSLVLK